MVNVGWQLPPVLQFWNFGILEFWRGARRVVRRKDGKIDCFVRRPAFMRPRLCPEIEAIPQNDCAPFCAKFGAAPKRRTLFPPCDPSNHFFFHQKASPLHRSSNRTSTVYKVPLR
ncbi:unnamed protein product, partial [Ectocarpus sp. 13 AM-2016]